MAEMAVSFARDKLLPLIRDEANLLYGIPKEFADIQKELECIQGSLENADRMATEEGANTNKGLKTWVKDLREASFRIEDVIDEYMMLVEQQPHDPGCAALFCQIIHFIETLLPRHRIASEIQQIKLVIDEIKKRGKDYDFLNENQPSSEQGQSNNRCSQSIQWIDPRVASPHLDEAQVVGFENQRDELICWLVEGPAERIVISMIGMGGIGKTTLAGRVFNNQKVIAHFGGSRAWITVSQSYTVEGLLRDLLKKMCKEKHEATPPGISEMDRDSLIVEVKNYLQQKRYIVIFDDVWSIKFWGQIENAMLDSNSGSRILITTRSKDVVDSCTNSPSDKVHVLKHLTFEKSMELFCKKAFQCHNNGRCPEDLVSISSDFVKKCNGLPLAIVAIGSLLSRKEKTPFEWEKIRRSLSSETEKNPHLISIKKILGFSYDDMPYYLKPCLLYFGMYPDDYEVKPTRLIRQWIAEGFVKEEEGKTLEDTAQQYLIELVNRSLVQVSSFTIDGKPKRCRVHDLLHEMILRKFKDLSLCQYISRKDELMTNLIIRRLSIVTISDDLMGSTGRLHTRSLLVFAHDDCEDEESTLTKNFVQGIPIKYRLLKVIDFEDSPLSFVPENWGNLTHLRYLNLRNSKSPTHLMKFISKLQNLETLDIRSTNIREIPEEICKLKKLRHLLGDDMTLFQLKNGLGGMTSLQTLRDVTMDDDDDNGVELIRELGRLKQLRNLSLTDVKEEQGRTLCSSINEMTNLEKLRIDSEYVVDREVIDLPAISSLPMLRKLCLDGNLKVLPKWVSQLQNLVKLSLRRSKLVDDPLKLLQNMPHLLVLDMTNAYEGESLHFQDGGFQQLKELTLGPFYSLKSIIIDKGALCSLEFLQFWDIPELKVVPLGIQHLEKLELIAIDRMPAEFNESIAPDGGPEHPAIQHVPVIRISSDNGQRTRVIYH